MLDNITPSLLWKKDVCFLTLQQVTARLKKAAGQSPTILANASTSRPKSWHHKWCTVKRCFLHEEYKTHNNSHLCPGQDVWISLNPSNDLTQDDAVSKNVHLSGEEGRTSQLLSCMHDHSKLDQPSIIIINNHDPICAFIQKQHCACELQQHPTTPGSHQMFNSFNVLFHSSIHLPSRCTAPLAELQEPSSRGSPRWPTAAFQHHHCNYSSVALTAVLNQRCARETTMVHTDVQINKEILHLFQIPLGYDLQQGGDEWTLPLQKEPSLVAAEQLTAFSGWMTSEWHQALSI